MVAAVMSAAEPKATRRRSSATSVNAWLLLLPAIVLLATFTHYPILATLYQHLGIDPGATLPDFSGRPMYLLDERRTVAELF